MEEILNIKNLYKKVDNMELLKNINLKVNKGEFVAIMGPSGSGKSTLLYNVSLMDKPTSGKVIFEKQELVNLTESEQSEIRLKKMGVVFQHAHLLKNLSIVDNILLPGLKANQESKQDIMDRATDLMKKLGIIHIASHDIHKVSGGELQRAAISRALINKPSMIFADEPTGALNSSTTEEVMDVFNTIHKMGTTILLVTHNPQVASYADRVIYFQDGTIADELNFIGITQGEIHQREQLMMNWLERNRF